MAAHRVQTRVRIMDMMCVCVCVCRQKARQTTNVNAGTTVLVGDPQVRDVASREWVCVSE